jgi:hypothetical protein
MSKYNHRMVVIYDIYYGLKTKTSIIYSGIKMTTKQVWGHNALWLTKTL